MEPGRPDDGEETEISAFGQRAIGQLLDKGREISEKTGRETPPERLFHFTNASGAIGILKDERLWASRAMCLNDSSEVLYGIQLVRDHLARSVDTQSLKRKAFRQTALAYLDPSRVERALRVHADPFVVSFSETDRESFHWLHYGREGDGYSLGFDASKLARKPFELHKVEYAPERQAQIIDYAVSQLEEAFLDLAYEREHRDVVRVGESAAIVFDGTMWTIAARLKHPSFRGEGEWRLITLNIRGEHIDVSDGVQMPMKFRSVGNRDIVKSCGSGLIKRRPSGPS